MMDTIVQFLFRGKLYFSEVIIDASAEPLYLFCLLQDKMLIQEFGEEITIKTDFEKRLPKKDDYRELVEIRQAIFNAAENTLDFQKIKVRSGIKY